MLKSIRRWIMKTKEIMLEYEGNETKFVIKRLSFGERTEIEQQSAPLRQIGTEVRMFPDRAMAKLLTVVKGLASAPFTINLVEVKKLDGGLGEELYQEIEKFNSLPDKKKANSSGPSTREQEAPKSEGK
jgi:hypothetical protein